MRVPKSWVPLLAKKVAENLAAKDMVRVAVPMDKFIAKTEELIMEELMVEDRVNEEVRDLLKKELWAREERP